MKFSIDIEMTPEEFRRAMGWPDISSLQDDLVAQARAQLAEGAEGYDPLSMLAGFMKAGPSPASTEPFQQMMSAMMKPYQRGSSSE